jgi:hypothetical protein
MTTHQPSALRRQLNRLGSRAAGGSAHLKQEPSKGAVDADHNALSDRILTALAVAFPAAAGAALFKVIPNFQVDSHAG